MKKIILAIAFLLFAGLSYAETNEPWKMISVSASTPNGGPMTIISIPFRTYQGCIWASTFVGNWPLLYDQNGQYSILTRCICDSPDTKYCENPH